MRGVAGQGSAGQGHFGAMVAVTRIVKAGRCGAGLGMARRGTARQGEGSSEQWWRLLRIVKAWRGAARRGAARRGMAGRGTARQGKGD